MIDYRIDRLVADIKRLGSIPTSQRLLTNPDLVDFLDRNQRDYIIPTIMKTREEFFVATYDTPVITSPANAPQAYALPTRAIGHKIRKMIVVDMQGNEVQLPRIEPENKLWHETFAWWPGTKAGYYFEGDKIMLTPNLNNSFSTVRMKYFRRPGRLIANSEAATIVSIDTGTGELVVDAIPSAMSAGVLVDIVNSQPTFSSRADDEAIISVDAGAPSITVSTATAAKLSVGDYICPAGMSVVPQYPEELHPILVQLALVDTMKALGDTQGKTDAEEALADLEQNLYILLGKRDEGSPRKIMSRRGIFDTGGI